MNNFNYIYFTLFFVNYKQNLPLNLFESWLIFLMMNITYFRGTSQCLWGYHMVYIYNLRAHQSYACALANNRLLNCCRLLMRISFGCTILGFQLRS